MVREPITVVVSEKGWIRALRGHVSDLSGVTFKTDDALKFAFPTETTAKILIFASNGKFYTLEASKLPGGRGHGEPVRLYFDIEQDADVVAALAYQGGRKFLVASYGGNGFVVPEDEVLGTTRKGKQVLNLKAPTRRRRLTTVDGELVAAIGENRKMVIFPLDQVPEMTRGRGVRLQRYKEKGLSDVTTFKARRRPHLDRRRRPQLHADAEGARQDWRGNRGDAGRIAPEGFLKNNKFRARRLAARERRGRVTRRSTRHEQQRAVGILQQRRCGVAEEQLFAGPAADAHDDQIVLAPLRLVENGLVGGIVGQHRGADAHVVAVGDRDDVLQDRFFVAAGAQVRGARRACRCATAT